MDNNRLNTADHDLLIRVESNLQNIMHRFDTFETSLMSRLVKTEARLDQIDLYHAAIPLKNYDDAYKWIESIRSNVYLLLTLGGIITAILGALAQSVLTNWLHL